MRRLRRSQTRDLSWRATSNVHRRAITVGAIAAGTIAAAFPAAGQADEAQQLTRQAAAAERAVAREAQQQLREEQRNLRREERENREPKNQSPKEKRGDTVKVSCSSIVVEYSGFPEGLQNKVEEYVSMRSRPLGLEWVETPATLTFDGSSTSTTIPIVPPIGRSMIKIHARWRPTITAEGGGGWDIHGMVVQCPPVHAFTLEERQAIAGSGKPATSAPLSAHQGQTIDYETIIKNTGNTPLTFSDASDTRCGELEGLPAGALAARQSLTLKCSHTLTIADAGAGQYVNSLSIKGSDEGVHVVHESNKVVVSPQVEEGSEPGTGGGTTGGGTGPGGSEPGSPPASQTPQSGALDTSSSGGSTSGASTAKSGVLSYTPFAVPALRGPHGCLRPTNFRVSLKSTGVQSVVFYLDGHRMRTLTAKAARKGVISIAIGDMKLRVGVHKVTAKITMKNNGTAKGRIASRSLLVARCASSTARPRFTG
jgi:hypothetical protein